MAVTLRELANPDLIYTPSDLTRLYPEDWNLVKDAICDGTEGIDTAGVDIAGTTCIDGSLTGYFVQLEPDVDATRSCGTALKRWNAVYAVTFYGSGASMTGVLASTGYAQGDIIKANGSGVLGALTIGAAGTYLSSDGTDPSWAGLDMDDATAGTLAIARGGTGLTGYARGDLIRADAINSLAALTIGTVGKYLRTDGTDPSWVTLDMGDAGAGTLAQARGGTGFASYTQGDLLVADSAPALVKLGIGATGKFLRSDGSNPGWQTITTADVSDARTELQSVLAGSVVVDFNTAATTNLYIVPAGKTAFVTDVIVEGTSAAAGTAMASVGVTGAGYTDIAADQAITTTTTTFQSLALVATPTIALGGTHTVTIKVNTPEGSALTGNVTVLGYLI